MTLPPGPIDEPFVKAHLRPLFDRHLTSYDGIYLANHSLGRPPDQSLKNVDRAMALWAERMDDCWSDDAWMGEAKAFRARIGRILGLSGSDCVVPKASAGQGLRAVLNSFARPDPLQIVTTLGEFDSIDFTLRAYEQAGAAQVAWVDASARDGVVPLFEPEPIAEAIGPETDLVVASLVFFTTGQILKGLDLILDRARANGSLLLLDVYHAAGALPLPDVLADVDFLIGGSYKYLRGGPGAGYLAVHPRHLGRRTLDTGWFAKRETFSYERPPTPEFAEGGDAWLESTPAVLTAYQANPGLEIVEALGAERIRQANLERQRCLRDALRANGVPVFDPRRDDEYGAFVLIPHSDADALAKALAKSGACVDARSGFVRLGPDFLNSFVELERAAEIVGKVASQT